jgi:hypothetical protein
MQATLNIRVARRADVLGLLVTGYNILLLPYHFVGGMTARSDPICYPDREVHYGGFVAPKSCCDYEMLLISGTVGNKPKDMVENTDFLRLCAPLWPGEEDGKLLRNL